MTPTVLTIAGSDSGGGAGIQADLKAFARCGVHGTSAVTAVTAQNTLGVSAIHYVPAEIVLAQVRAVLGDIRVDAVKVGMLGSAEVTLAVAAALDELPAGTPVVVDPVMVAESGARLLAVEAERALIEEIVPRASVLTPNVPEARALTGRQPAVPGQREARAGGEEPLAATRLTRSLERAEAEALAIALLALGPRAVVLTGGHREHAVDLFVDRGDEDSVDLFMDRGGEESNERGERAGRVVEIEGERHPDGAAHGSGCTHSSVLAAQLALGCSPLDAARSARALAGAAIAAGLRDIGAGAGPVDVIGLERMRSGCERPRRLP